MIIAFFYCLTLFKIKAKVTGIINIHIAIMLEAIPPEIQLILVIILIAVLFVLILLNNKHNRKKRYEREQRNFRKNIHQKRRNKNK